MYIKYFFPKKDHLNSAAHYTRKERNNCSILCFVVRVKALEPRGGLLAAGLNPLPIFGKIVLSTNRVVYVVWMIETIGKIDII